MCARGDDTHTSSRARVAPRRIATRRRAYIAWFCCTCVCKGSRQCAPRVAQPRVDDATAAARRRRRRRRRARRVQARSKGIERPPARARRPIIEPESSSSSLLAPGQSAVYARAPRPRVVLSARNIQCEHPCRRVAPSRAPSRGDSRARTRVSSIRVRARGVDVALSRRVRVSRRNRALGVGVR
jgi:hypothetical protein